MNAEPIEHHELVRRLAKPGLHIVEELTPENAHRWHMASCICGEAGELFDAIKKHVLYSKPLDRENVIEELGDIEFYMEGLRQSLGLTRAETVDANITKLTARYHSGKFSNEQAQARKDKEVGE